MADTFREWMEKLDDVKLSKTRKRLNRKRKDKSSKNVYGWDGYGPPPNISGAPAGGASSGGVSERYNRSGWRWWEEDEEDFDDEFEPQMSDEFDDEDEYERRYDADRDEEDDYDAECEPCQGDDEYVDDDEWGDKEDADFSEPDYERDDEWNEDELGPDYDDEDELDPEFAGLGTFKDFYRMDHEEDEEDDYDPRYDNVQGDRERHRDELDDLRRELPYDPDDPEDVGFTDDDYENYDDYEEDPFRDDVEADADTLRNVGWGTDEDYGFFGDDEFGEYEEEQEEVSKKQQARGVYMQLKNAGHARKRIIDEFERRLQLTPSSAVAYYERIAKEFGDTGQEQEQPPAMPGAVGGFGMDDMMGAGAGDAEMMGPEGEDEYQEPQEWEDPNRQGVIRRVDNAHLVFKRQADDGSFTEMWIYKQGKNKLRDELEIRRDILAGTDIPVTKTQSDDGKQEAELWSVGDVQFLQITGLPN